MSDGRLTLAEAAARCDRTPTALRAAVTRGRLPATAVGVPGRITYLVTPADLAAYLASRFGGNGARAPRGENNGQARLTAAQVREIRARYGAGHGETLRTLATDYQVSKSTIHRIVNGERWAHVE